VNRRLRDLTGSLASFGWGLSLFALDQLGRAWRLAASGGDADAAGAAAAALSWAAHQQLGEILGPVLGSADRAQREMVNRVLAGRAAGIGAELLADLAAFGICLLPGQSSAFAWRELSNKLEVCWLAAERREAAGRAGDLGDVGPGAGDHGGDGGSLATAVAAAYRREPFAVLFTLERLGREAAVAALEAGDRGGPPRRLLAAAGGLPAASLILLHTGMGMGFARRLLATAGPPGSPGALVRTLDRFVSLCRDNSVAGYEAAALEALGLVVRIRHPDMVAAVDRELRGIGQELPGLFWHGAGRALYFLPGQLPPGAGSLPRQSRICRGEAPPDCWVDAASGLFYAAAMVNLRHPELLFDLFRSIGDQAQESEVFADAAAAAVLVRYATTPDDPALAALLAYRPERPAGAGSWERRLQASCELALRDLYPLLAQRRRFGLLARHRDLAELLGRLREDQG
jgi:hypothetical protein